MPSSIDDYALEAGMCVSHCEHGGVCILPLGHESTHDSKFCRWLDKEAISKEEADKRLATMPGGKQTLELEDLFFGGKHDD